jgi:hypothetical protein
MPGSFVFMQFTEAAIPAASRALVAGLIAEM